MAYAEIHATSPVTSEMRKLFTKLVLKTEPRDTKIWALTGSEQATIRRDGDFHHEGRYLLSAVTKKWAVGFLAATSLSASEPPRGATYCVRTPELLAYSTNRAALAELFPGVNIVPWSYDGGMQ